MSQVSPPPAAWLDLAAALDEHGNLVAVRLGTEVVARDAFGTTLTLRPIRRDCIHEIVAFLNERTRSRGEQVGDDPVTRFASASLTYEVGYDSVLQMHRWPAAASWLRAVE